MTTAGRRRFVLLDRDGTINVERDHLTDPDRIELIDGAAEALRDLAARGFGLVVVTNQSPIGRGMMDRARLAEIHERLTRELAARGARLDGIYFCPHHPDAGCACRKPATGMAEQASAEHGFEPSECFVVGDSEGDIGLARALGATGILVRTGRGAETERAAAVHWDHVVDDLPAATQLIERLSPVLLA